MKASDPTLHAQMHHLAASARKAVAANKAILIIEFWDEDAEKDCTMLMYDCREPDGGKAEVVRVVISTLQAIQSMFSSTSDLQLTIHDKETGETMEIDRHDAFMRKIELE